MELRGDWRPRQAKKGKTGLLESDTGFIVLALGLTTALWFGMKWYTEHQAQIAHTKELNDQISAQEAYSAAEDRRRAEEDKIRTAQNKQREQAEEKSEGERGKDIAAMDRSRIFNDGNINDIQHTGGFVQALPSPDSPRTVQQEYELSSRIMESAAAETNPGQPNYSDQQRKNDWWLNTYEHHCDPYQYGTIGYRHCRAEWKKAIMRTCQQRQDQSSDHDAQCYAANNFQIVK